ncbi:hypothetical protein ABIB95_009340 [Bradyrhizobium sp. LA2.1]
MWGKWRLRHEAARVFVWMVLIAGMPALAQDY